jgi:hypothetical protein
VTHSSHSQYHPPALLHPLQLVPPFLSSPTSTSRLTSRHGLSHRFETLGQGACRDSDERSAYGLSTPSGGRPRGVGVRASSAGRGYSLPRRCVVVPSDFTGRALEFALVRLKSLETSMKVVSLLKLTVFPVLSHFLATYSASASTRNTRSTCVVAYVFSLSSLLTFSSALLPSFLHTVSGGHLHRLRRLQSACTSSLLLERSHLCFGTWFWCASLPSFVFHSR